jgi:hypothetical protein
MATIITPRPPLNLFEVRRVPFTGAWTTVYDVPSYTIPADGPNPQRVVGTAAIMTGLMIANSNALASTVSIRILRGTEVAPTIYPVATEIVVYPNDLTMIPLDRQIMRDGERIQVQSNGASLMVHFTFILNQREEYTEIVA